MGGSRDDCDNVRYLKCNSWWARIYVSYGLSSISARGCSFGDKGVPPRPRRAQLFGSPLLHWLCMDLLEGDHGKTFVFDHKLL